jgi:hypothetical protein
MLIRPAIGDTEPIRHRRPNPDGQFSGNILDEAMRQQVGPVEGMSKQHRCLRYAVKSRCAKGLNSGNGLRR